jgi:iron complex outermembrane receptor protein
MRRCVEFVLKATLLLLLSCGLSASAKNLDENNRTIKGRVLTNDNKPAAGVTVLLTGTKRSVQTDENGEFVFKNVTPGTYQLSISLVGYETSTQTVVVAINELTAININLKVSEKQLEEVVVTGSRNKFASKTSTQVSKMPLKNIENSQVYTTVGKELIQEQAVFSAEDAVKNSPGITKLWTANGRVGDGGAYFTVRGFPVQILLRNGLSGIVTSNIDAINLEKLEVIKGPLGTLYGSTLTSYGGLINRVTKKPYENFGGEVAYAGGSYDFNRVSADINTPLDSAKRALLRINTAYNSINSFQDNGFNRNFAFDPSFTYKINNRLTFTVEAEISHTVATTPVMFFFNTTVADLGVDRADKLVLDYKKSYQSDDIAVTSDNANFFALMEYKISDKWKSQTNISTTSSASKGPQAYFYLIPGNDSLSRNIWTVDGTSNALQIQQNFVGDFKIGKLRNRLVAGLDYLSQKANIRYIDPANGSDNFDIINTTGPIPNYNNFDLSAVNALYQNQPKSTSYNRYNNNTYSVYASDVLNITDKLLVSAGARIDYFNTQPIVDATSGTSSVSFDQAAISPKFGLVYELVKNKVSLFGNYMNGFTNPGYNLSYDAATNSNVSKLFKSEQANQWEGGVKLDVFDGKLSSTISYYDINVKNKVRPDVQHANANVQDGTQYSRGFEAEIIANPFRGFNIVAGYAYNDSKMGKSSDYDNGKRPQTAGPVNSANLWLSYTLTNNAAKGLGIGFGGNYAGDNAVLNNSYNGTFILPAYVVLNAGVFYNQPKYRIAVNVNNLANTEYWIGYTTVNPQMLRQVIGSIAFKF